MLFTEYIANPENYKKHHRMFKRMLFKKSYSNLELIDDLYHEKIIAVINIENKKGEIWDNELHCSNYFNLALENCVTVTQNKKNKIYYSDINECYHLAYEDDSERNERNSKENFLKFQIETWMNDNLEFRERELFKTWYYNKLTYRELAIMTSLEKTYIFLTIKNIKNKIKKEFKDIEF